VLIVLDVVLVSTFVAPVNVLAEPAVPIVLAAPLAVRFPVTPRVLLICVVPLKVVVPVTPRVPPTVALLVILAELRVAAPEVERCVVPTPPFASSAPVMVVVPVTPKVELVK
jgi:hypothetical protein